MLLATVTHKANNHRVAKSEPDGSFYWATVRDCSAPSTKKAAKVETAIPRKNDPDSIQVELLVSSDSEGLTPICERRRRARAEASTTRKQAQAKYTEIAIINATRGSKRDASEAAGDRLEAVKQRVRERISGSSGMYSTPPASHG